MSLTVQTLFGTFNEKELKEIKGCINEMIECMRKIDAEKELYNDIVDVTYTKYKIPKKIIKKIATTYHKQSFQEMVAENNEFEALFEGISEVK